MNTDILKQVVPTPYFVIPGFASERGQATARLTFAVIFAFYLCATYSKFGHAPQYKAAWFMLATQAVFATGFMFWVHTRPSEFSARRMSAVLLDQGLCGAILLLTGEIAAPFVLMPLLLTFGSGLRYGRVFGLLSWVVGLLLMCSLVTLSPYWSRYPAIGLGLAAAMAFVPPYVFRLTDELAMSSRTDAMTKLRNKQGFNELLDKLCRDVVSAQIGGAVVLIDLDGFNKINDEQGHDGGDEVLKHIAYWLCVELGMFGPPARFGGDEFSVIIDKLANSNTLESALNRFLERAAAVGELFGSPLSASIGVYQVPAGSVVTPRFVFKAADELMYLAKKMGKKQYQTSTGATFCPDGKLKYHPSLPVTPPVAA